MKIAGILNSDNYMEFSLRVHIGITNNGTNIVVLVSCVKPCIDYEFRSAHGSPMRSDGPKRLADISSESGQFGTRMRELTVYVFQPIGRIRFISKGLSERSTSTGGLQINSDVVVMKLGGVLYSNGAE